MFMQFKQITDKSIYHYKGKVYDLTVDGAHSYNVNNFIVHNSGAGSLVNHALGITQINPLDYDLIFERKQMFCQVTNCARKIY